MWLFQIFDLLWTKIYTLPMGFYGFTFGGFILAVFATTFLAGIVYAFMHRKDD